MIRVVLVDDDELIRVGFRMILEGEEDLQVVGEADDGDTALHLLRTVEADVVLTDVRMPRMDGVEVTRRLREREDSPKVLVLTTFDLDEYAYAALAAGASGFLLKNTPPRDLVSSIRAVHAGSAVVAPTTTRRLIDRFAGQLEVSSDTSAAHRALQSLTPRERDVLLLVARGLSNAEIADRLYVAEGTVKVHVGRILTKLELRDRVQAVILAYETGLIGRDQS